MTSKCRIAGLLAVSLLLGACSDSSSGIWGARDPEPPPPPGPPVAQAGADQTVARGASVWLSGGFSYAPSGGALGYAWSQVAGAAVTLSGASTPNASFVAPSVVTSLRFRLTVTDSGGRSSSDEVTVSVGDAPPVISSLTVGPPAPITTDRLVASAVVHDPDPSDVVSLSWEWRRNGAPLVGQTGPELPARVVTRGDRVEVKLGASDGQLETTATATVTIQDAPPSLAISAPETVTWGTPFTFTAGVSDPDGDPVGGGPATCVLRRGPAGMTVTPACEGAWTPTLPMFDRELEVTFEVGLAGTTAGAAARTVRVADPARRYPLRRSGFDLPIAQNGLLAIDPEGGGTATLLVAAATGLYEVAFATGTYQQVWAYPFAATGGAPAAVEAGDVDGDGRPELFVSSAPSWYSGTAATLVKLDGADRREVARVAEGCLDLELADLDRDGVLELACLADQRLVLLDPRTLATTWQSEPLPLGGRLAAGNVDSDAALELVTSGGYVVDGATHAVEWSYVPGFGAVDTGDLDGDGVEEIVGRDSRSRFRGFSAVLKAPLWEVTTVDNDALLVTDLTGDGVAEIVVGDGQWGNVSAYRYRPDTNDLALLFAVDSQEYGVSSLAAADLDADGAAEVAWGSGAGSSGADVLAVASATGLEWRSGDPRSAVSPAQLDGPFLGAVPARLSPGAPPALLFQTARSNAGYAGARLVRLDPSGAVSVSAEIGTNWNRNGALAAADFDGDGVDEAFLATASLYDGYLVAWDFLAGAAAWTSPPGVGNGRAVVAADLNGDGAPDLVTVTTDGYVMAYDVLHAALLFRSTSVGWGVGLAVADLEGGGEPTVVALAGNRLVLFHRAPSGPVPWLEGDSVNLSDAVDLAVGDCDGDGLPELHVLTGSPYSGGMTVRRFDGALAPLGSFAVRGSAQSLFIEDLGGARNLVLGKTDPYDYSASPPVELEAVDAVTGGRIWRSPPLAGPVPPGSLRYVDLDGDGDRELAFGTSAGMYLTR